MIPRVLGYLCPGDMGLGPPAVEQNTLLERLTSGVTTMALFSPPVFASDSAQWNSSVCSLSASIEREAPLSTEAEPPFSLSHVDDKFCKRQQRRSRDHTPLASHFPSGRDRAISDSPGVIQANVGESALIRMVKARSSTELATNSSLPGCDKRVAAAVPSQTDEALTTKNDGETC